MLKVLVIKSRSSEHPLAEVRTDGRVVDFIVDNTDGMLTSQVGKDFNKLQQIIAQSSYLTIEETQEVTTHLLRYLLDNGDVVEITTDGKTCILNGKISSEQEKAALFAAIQRGELKVTRRADLASPVPVMPAMQQAVKPASSPQFHPQIMASIKQQMQEDDKRARQANAQWDHSIEMADLRGAEDKEYVKQFLYKLKHGK